MYLFAFLLNSARQNSPTTRSLRTTVDEKIFLGSLALAMGYVPPNAEDPLTPLCASHALLSVVLRN